MKEKIPAPKMFSKPQITPKKIWSYEGKNSCSKNVLKTPKQPKFGVKKTQMATVLYTGGPIQLVINYIPVGTPSPIKTVNI